MLKKIVKRSTIVLLAIVVLCGICLADDQPKNLFIMGWDGAGMNNVLPMLQAGQLPNLKRLLDDHNASLLPVENITMTCTVPNWTMFFTGMTPDQTGAYTNYPMTETKVGWGSVLSSIKYGLLRHFHANGYRVGWFASKMYLSTNKEVSPLADIISKADEQLVVTPRKDDYIWKLRDAAVKFIEAGPEPWLVFIHTDPDQYGHESGENSQEYLGEFVRSDTVLGDLLAKIKLFRTKVIVVSDHGFDEGGFMHKNAPDNFVVTTLPVAYEYRSTPYHTPAKAQRAVATMRDFYPTILSYFNVEYPTNAVPQQIRGKNLLR